MNAAQTVVFSEHLEEENSVDVVQWKGTLSSGRENQGEHFYEAIEVFEGGWKGNLVLDEFTDFVDVTFSAPLHVTFLILSLIKS